jgi:hypothetical protein
MHLASYHLYSPPKSGFLKKRRTFSALSFCVANAHAVDREAQESQAVCETQAGVANGPYGICSLVTLVFMVIIP